MYGQKVSFYFTRNRLEFILTSNLVPTCTLDIHIIICTEQRLIT